MSKALEGIRVIDFTHAQAGPAYKQMPAVFGEHTEDVLTTLGGYTPEDVKRLRDKGVV